MRMINFVKEITSGERAEFFQLHLESIEKLRYKMIMKRLYFTSFMTVGGIFHDILIFILTTP